MKLKEKLKTMFKRWYDEDIHHTMSEQPQANAGENRIPCIVFGSMFMGQAIWYWNVSLGCWEDVDCDGIFSECKEEVESWIYIRELR